MGVAGRLASVAVLVITALAPAVPVHGRATSLEPLVWGWEGIFKLDWQVEERRGAPVVSGYVLNDSPYTLSRVQLLVDALDDTGAVVRQVITWIPGDVLPAGRSYFEVPAPGRQSKYQVRVFAYDRVEAGGQLL